jgi:hypothetical protein
LPLISAQKQFPASQYYPTRRPIAVIPMVMQKSRDLPLWRRRMPEAGEGNRTFEEIPLDFGRKSAPLHNDGRSQTFQNFSVVSGRPIAL